MVKASSRGENQDRILSIIESVGARGFLLLQPECKLILEGEGLGFKYAVINNYECSNADNMISDEMYLPATSKRVTGTIRRRPIHCYLYSNALVVISMDKKVSTLSHTHTHISSLYRCDYFLYENVHQGVSGGNSFKNIFEGKREKMYKEAKGEKKVKGKKREKKEKEKRKEI